MGTLSDSKISWLWRNRAARNRQSRQTSVKQQGGFLCLTSFDLIYYVLELNRRARTKLWSELLPVWFRGDTSKSAKSASTPPEILQLVCYIISTVSYANYLLTTSLCMK